MFLKKIYFIILSFIFISCGDNSIKKIDLSDKENKTDCSQEKQNRVVYNKMKDNYLWYQYLPDIEYKEYNSTETLLNDLRYKEYDEWSYITSTTQYNNFYEKGVYYGFGFSIKQNNNRIFVTYVYNNSPAQKAGFKRGTEIINIDNKIAYRIKDKNFLKTMLDNKTEANFKIINDNIIKSVTIRKSTIKLSSVLLDKIFYIDDKKIGYFVLNRFIEPTYNELEVLFDKFKKEEIDELILDMRYNGGGRISVANYLASLIGGETTQEMPFETLEYNDKNSNLNTTLNFSKEKNSLNLDRVFIISTENTCSASESLINGLSPYITVNLIGSKTCGKPVGMNGVDFCGKHLSPIVFKTVNAEGYSDYFSGIEPRCHVLDDTLHQLGNRDEAMLKESLFFIKYNICSSVTKRYQEEKREKKENISILKGFQKEINSI